MSVLLTGQPGWRPVVVAAGGPVRARVSARRSASGSRYRVGSGAEPGLGHPDHRDAELGVRMRAQAGPAAGVQVGVAVDHQQVQPAQIVQDRAQRRQLAQVELARPVGRYPGYYRGAFGQHVREGGTGGQDGCRPGAAGAQVVRVHGGAHAVVRAPAGFHVSRMPESGDPVKLRVRRLRQPTG